MWVLLGASAIDTNLGPMLESLRGMCCDGLGFRDQSISPFWVFLLRFLGELLFQSCSSANFGDWKRRKELGFWLEVGAESGEKFGFSVVFQRITCCSFF